LAQTAIANSPSLLNNASKNIFVCGESMKLTTSLDQVLLPCQLSQTPADLNCYEHFQNVRQWGAECDEEMKSAELAISQKPLPSSGMCHIPGQVRHAA
jgi:hypothetical protein